MPLFYTFELFSTNCLGKSVDTYVECDTFNTEKYEGVPYLDVTAVYSEVNNSVFVNVVNRHEDRTITADITATTGEFAGKAEANIITCASLNEPFTFDKQEQYIPISKEIKTEKNKISFSFPAHSFTQIKIEIRRK